MLAGLTLIAKYDYIIPVYFYAEPARLLSSVFKEVHLSVQDNDGYCAGINCNDCPINDCSRFTNLEWMVQLCPKTKLKYPELFI